MKNIVLTLLILAIMIFTMSFSIKYLNKASYELGKINEEIKQSIDDDNWDKAYKIFLELSNKWEDYSKKIKIFANHQEIDNIEMELQKLPQFIKERAKDQSLASVHVLEFLLNHISELEKVKIQNVF